MRETFRPSKPQKPLQVYNVPGACIFRDELTGELCGQIFPVESPRNRKWCDKHKKIIESRKK